jgi:lysophospholipase L1-like esterase
MAQKARRFARAASDFRLKLFLGLALGLVPAMAQEAGKDAGKDPGKDPKNQELVRASSCDVPADSLAAPAPLPNSAAALKQTQKLRILIIGSPVGVGRGARKSYPAILESLLERAVAGLDAIIVNRPVSGETLATAAERMRTEVALTRPNLLIWQVGANDALARVPPDSFELDLRENVRWARENGVDVLLVGFEANPWLHDDQEVSAIRDATSRIAKVENVLYLRRNDAMQFLARTRNRVEQGDNPTPAEIGYDCMAEQVAQALVANLVLRRSRPAPTEP